MYIYLCMYVCSYMCTSVATYLHAYIHITYVLIMVKSRILHWQFIFCYLWMCVRMWSLTQLLLLRGGTRGGQHRSSADSAISAWFTGGNMEVSSCLPNGVCFNFSVIWFMSKHVSMVPLTDSSVHSLLFCLLCRNQRQKLFICSCVEQKQR